MSGRNQKKAKSTKERPWYEAAWLTGLLLVAVAAYTGLALTGNPGAWWGILSGENAGDFLALPNPGGPVGSVLNVTLRLVFGSLWCWTLPFLLATLGIELLLPWLVFCCWVLVRVNTVRMVKCMRFLVLTCL